MVTNWVGKVAVITGASSGIGAKISKKLVQEGMQVIGLARRHVRIYEMAKELKDNGAPGMLHAMKCDITNEDNVKNVFEDTKTKFGKINLLINNAAVAHQCYLTDSENTGEKMRAQFETNVLGAAMCAREAIRLMQDDTSQIININSAFDSHGEFTPYPHALGLYPVTKHALRALSENLREELALKNINVKISNINPGIVCSDFYTKNGFKVNPLSVNKTTFLEADDVTDAVIYILTTPPHVQVKDITLTPIGAPKSIF